MAERVLVAMSGGVDSSVAAAALREAGHEVVGITLRLWGGESDSGCCSVSDVEDARRVAQQLDIEHHVFNLADEFSQSVVGPYVAEHERGRTPNPCIECNRHLKFDRLLQRTEALGFDRLATGHHAQVLTDAGGRPVLSRGADPTKDQSYVLYVLGAPALPKIMFPIGAMTKDEVREHARRLGLRTAGKPDSQDVCFITSTEGRGGFLSKRARLHPGKLVDHDGEELGEVDAVELVTVGQRRGLGLSGGGEHRYAVDVDIRSRTVTIGTAEDLEVDTTSLERVVWTHPGVVANGSARIEPMTVLAQASAHGSTNPARLAALAPGGTAELRWEQPARRIAPGQSVAFYDPHDNLTVLGGGIVSH